MRPTSNYEKLLKTSRRVNWRVDDLIGGGRRLDFTRPFLPETFARTGTLAFLTPGERLTLNHIRGCGYLSMFELVERCILPHMDALVPSAPGQDCHRSPALAQFSAEETKHIELFVRFREEFEKDFPVACEFIGPVDEIGAALLAHGRLGLAVFTLAIEWATQRHYLESVRDDASLDPQFKSLLKHHWIEEAQHVKLDALVFRELVEQMDASAIDHAIDDFLDMGGYIDDRLRRQAELDLASFEAALGRRLSEDDRAEFLTVQHQALRWTFLGSALTNAGFLETLGSVSPAARTRIEEVAPAFC